MSWNGLKRKTIERHSDPDIVVFGAFRVWGVGFCGSWNKPGCIARM